MPLNPPASAVKGLRSALQCPENACKSAPEP